jgi:hypothetical protein
MRKTHHPHYNPPNTDGKRQNEWLPDRCDNQQPREQGHAVQQQHHGTGAGINV